MKTVILLFFFIFFNFVMRSQYCLSASQTPRSPTEIPSVSEIITNSSILKDLLTNAKDETVKRKYQFDYLYFKMMNCKGTFDADAGNIFRELCDYCFFSGPRNINVRNCKTECFSTKSFNDCLEFYSQEKNIEIKIFKPLLQKLNGSLIVGS